MIGATADTQLVLNRASAAGQRQAGCLRDPELVHRPSAGAEQEHRPDSPRPA